MLRSHHLGLVSLAVAAALLVPAADGAEGDSAEILRRYAADFARDPSLTQPLEFGIEVRGDGEPDRWQVRARPASGESEATVEVSAGFPAKPSYYFTVDRETLLRLDRGELNALTAMAKARQSDAAPMDVGVMEGFAPGPGFVADLLSVCFHFWTRGLPERIPYGSELTRPVHGAQASVFYYQPGFRSAWVELRPGQHANADPTDQRNPFPTLFISLSGRAKARIGGAEVELAGSEATFIPPNTPHEFWNPYGEPAQGILLMFGNGA